MLKKVNFEMAYNAYQNGEKVLIHAREKWTPIQNAIFAVDYAPRQKRKYKIVTKADRLRMESLLAQGYTYQRIAEETEFSLRTVIRYLNRNGGV